jgi:methylated-DNA-[protein]-cysteine S-methyltransferase
VSAQIPFLRDAVQQLQEYFNSQRTDFTFKLNPKGTDFQQKCGTHYSIFRLVKQEPI